MNIKLPIASCWYEIWSFMLIEEQSSRVFEDITGDNM